MILEAMTILGIICANNHNTTENLLWMTYLLMYFEGEGNEFKNLTPPLAKIQLSWFIWTWYENDFNARYMA